MMFWVKVWRGFLSRAQICLKCPSASSFKIFKMGNIILGPNQGCFGFRTKWIIFQLRQKLFSHENFLEECVEAWFYRSKSGSSRPSSRNQIAQSDPICPWSQKLLTILLLSPTHAAWSAALAIETNWLRWGFLCYLCPIRVMYHYTAIEIKQGLAPRAK